MTSAKEGPRIQARPAGPARIPLALAWLALTAYFFQPANEVLDTTLDPSIFSSYAYLTAHGFQYGKDIVPMAGPYGFVMYGQVYGGDLFWIRTLCALLLTGLFAGLVLWFYRLNRQSGARFLWLCGHLLFTAFSADLIVAWTLLLVGWFLLHDDSRSRPPAWTLAAAAVLAWLAMFKGTHLVLSLAIVTVVTVATVLMGDRRRAAVIAAAYAGAFVCLWLAAGQNPLNIPGHLAGIFHLTRGYNDAMAIDEAGHIFARGAGVALVFTAATVWAVWRHRRDVATVAGFALLAGCSFVMWKHGFVRADGHMYIFFGYMIAASAAWYLHGLVPTGEPGGPRTRPVAPVVLALLVFGSFYGRNEPNRPNLPYLAGLAADAAWRRPVHLLTLPSAKADLDARLQAERRRHDLALTRDEIGAASIDFFGHQQGILPLNRLNYTPRPMGGGAFNVYNRRLMELNRDFVRDPDRRPRFYLVGLQTIDDRFTAQDDGLTLRELLTHYSPVLVDHAYVLMEARPDGTTSPDPRPLETVSFSFGERIDVPAVAPDEMVLARFRISPNLRGRLRNLLYKSPVIQGHFHDDSGDEGVTRRIVPSMAAVPFILSPRLETNIDLLGLYTGQTGATVSTLELTTEGPGYFARELTVEFFAAPRPPPPELADAKSLITFARTPMEVLHLSKPGEDGGDEFRLVQTFHAPGSMYWRLNGNERALRFSYGLMPKAYEDGGRTDGVDFIVEAETSPGVVVEVFRRALDPVNRPADRGLQTDTVQLPPVSAGARLHLRTDPGIRGDTGWDWSYVADMRLIRGPYRLEQFPGFNHPPVAVEAGQAAPLTLGTDRIFMLNAPGALVFDAPAEARRLELAFGFLPGAHQDGGETDGADFVVEHRRADGSHVELFRRELRPQTREADQGRQEGVVALPARAAGDHIVVRTDPGPSGNASWDWTYLARLNFQ